jgi:hypothetical protein
MLLDVPDFLLVFLELLLILPPIILITVFVKVPGLLNIFVTVMKKGNFVLSLGADNNIKIKPAKLDFDLWKVYSGVGKKAVIIQSFESDPRDTIGFLNRPSILVRDSLTRATNADVNKLIEFMQKELNLKTKQDFQNALNTAKFYREKITEISEKGGYWDKEQFIKISGEDYWKQLPKNMQEFLNLFSKLEDGGLVINGIWTIDIAAVEDYIDRHNPQTYAASEMYIEAKALTKGNSELKKLLMIVILIAGLTLLAVLFMHGSGGAAAGGVTAFVPK